MGLRARVLGAIAYILILATLAFGVPLGLSLSARVNAEVRTQAQQQADLVAATASDLLAPSSRRQLWALARTSSATLRGRVIIVGRDGRVLVDSAGPAEIGASYESRPELARALSGRPDQLQRRSRTLGESILATAVPIVHDGRTAGAVRVTQSVAAVHRAVLRVEAGLVLAGLVVLLVGLFAAWVLASGLVRPLARLEAVARRVAQGDLGARASEEGSREQRSLARSFNEMTERTSRLLGAQLAFVADASHQLRTPLTGLRLRLETARAASESAEARAELDRALQEVDRLAATVDELLVRSRAGERRLAGTTLALGDLADDAGVRWAAQAAERDIALSVRRTRDPGTVWAARSDIERALDALIENALRYSAAGTEVVIAASPCTIEIRDRGRGVAPGEQDLVFERARRGSAGRAGPSGHGLGLPIARELARAWGGEVRLHQRRSGGTTAMITLPGHERAGRPFARA